MLKDIFIKEQRVASMKKESFKIKWSNIDITVDVTFDWIVTNNIVYDETGAHPFGLHHVEIKSDQPNPISETGYRSNFMRKSNVYPTLDEIKEIVLQQLGNEPVQATLF